MPARTFANSDIHTRVWPGIIRPDNGQTLELEPGGTAQLDLPDDFSDPYLIDVTESYKDARVTRVTPPTPVAAKAAEPTPPAPTDKQED